MVKDDFEGFVPDEKPKYIIQGAGLIFFLTSCVLALTVFPALFTTAAFAEAEQPQYANPDEEQIQAIAGTAATHLGWTLAPFIVSGFLFRLRRDSIVYATALVALAIWLIDALPFSSAGNLLLVGSWAVATVALIIYRKELD